MLYSCAVLFGAFEAAAIKLCCLGAEKACALLQEDKLEPSEQLGDLLRQAGDADAALKCYRASGATTKVIEGKLTMQNASHCLLSGTTSRLLILHACVFA